MGMASDGMVDISTIKDGGTQCIGLFCVGCTCLMCESPCLAGNAKICCCKLGLDCRCPCITFEGASCMDDEHGCCEVATKTCCIVTEAQYPPSGDIGLAFCGMKCCG